MEFFVLRKAFVFTVMLNFKHYPVLLKEAIDLLNIKPDGIYVDGTTGGGGHSYEILKKLSLKGTLICFDKDPDAIKHIKQKFENYSNVIVVHSDFKYILKKLDELNIGNIDGLLLDLGVSSYQLDQVDRGFCYNKDAVLDMRMAKSGVSAYDVVNSYSAEALAKIIFEYGEEKCSWKIAKNIEAYRKKQPIKTTYQLCEVIKEAIPAPLRRKGGNPCKRTFQAIRIAVNDELNSLTECINSSFKKLNSGGRFAIITFHSLEDRIVKQKFSALTKGCICPPGFPICVCGHKQMAKFVNKKPILPSNQELCENSRSKSAKLRVIEKL